MSYRITSIQDATEASEVFDFIDSLTPKPKAKPPVFRYKPRNARRPKHAKN